MFPQFRDTFNRRIRKLDTFGEGNGAQLAGVVDEIVNSLVVKTFAAVKIYYAQVIKRGGNRTN